MKKKLCCLLVLLFTVAVLGGCAAGGGQQTGSTTGESSVSENGSGVGEANSSKSDSLQKSDLSGFFPHSTELKLSDTLERMVELDQLEETEGSKKLREETEAHGEAYLLQMVSRRSQEIGGFPCSLTCSFRNQEFVSMNYAFTSLSEEDWNALRQYFVQRYGEPDYQPSEGEEPVWRIECDDTSYLIETEESWREADKHYYTVLCPSTWYEAISGSPDGWEEFFASQGL